MNERFQEYLVPCQSDFDDLWEKCDFVFDANVWLLLFKLSKSFSEDFIRIISPIKSRIWMPYQVGLEIVRNKVELEAKFLLFPDYLEKKIRELNALESEFNKEKHPLFEREEAVEIIKEALDKLLGLVRKSKNKDGLQKHITERWEEICNIISRIGTGYDKAKLESLQKEGMQRFDKNIPPGFADKNKSGDKAYGDFILWQEILDYAKEEKKSMIFITEDSKEDWFWQKEGKIFGPHPLLRQEFLNVTSQGFYMYSTQQFLKYVALKFISQPAKQDTMKELKSFTASEAARNKNQDLQVRSNVNIVNRKLLENTTSSNHYNRPLYHELIKKWRNAEELRMGPDIVKCAANLGINSVASLGQQPDFSYLIKYFLMRRPGIFDELMAEGIISEAELSVFLSAFGTP